MSRCPAALQIAWLADHRAACERRIFAGRTLPDWCLLAKIVGVCRTPQGALEILWRQEWRRVLALIVCRSIALPRALRSLLREVDRAEGCPPP